MGGKRTLGLPIGSVNACNKPICGAYIKRKKRYCEAPPLPSGRCACHGGFSAKIPRRPDWMLSSKGLYNKFLNAEEANLFDQLKVGSLEQEIKLLRIQLIRALQAQYDWQLDYETLVHLIKNNEGEIHTPEEIYKKMELEVLEARNRKGVDPKGNPIDEQEAKVSFRKRDFKSEITQLVRLIAKLEREHHEMMKQDIPDSERIAQIAAGLREFSQEANKTVSEEKDE